MSNDTEPDVMLHYNPMTMRGVLEKYSDEPWERLDFDPDEVPAKFHYGADDLDEILEKENTMDLHLLEATLASTGVVPAGKRSIYDE